MKEALLKASKELKAAGVETPSLDAEVLLSYSVGMDREDILLLLDKPLKAKEEKDFAQAIARRVSREPVALITGVKEFWSLAFKLNEETFIPSPDSETLVQTALSWAKGKTDLSILDLGTGSGCLLLSILSELEQAKGLGVDISERALDCAQKNANRLRLSTRVSFLVFDWMKGEPLSKDKFNLVISNPPYVAAGDKAILEVEVARFGPEQALYGGETGLKHIEKIISRIHEFLAPGGRIFMEVGAGQAKEVESLFRANDLEDIKTHRDLAGVIRVVTGTNP